MNNAHPSNQNPQESHLERAFANLKKHLYLSYQLREVIRAQLFEKIDQIIIEDTSSAFDLLKSSLVPDKVLIAKAKLRVMDKVERHRPFTWKSFWEKVFGGALGYGISFLFVISITSLFVVSNLQPSKAEFLGELQIRQGNAYIVRASNKFEVRSGEKVLPGDVIEVGDTGLVDINFYQQRQANLHSNTKVRIEKDAEDTSEIILSLEKGKIAATPSTVSTDSSITVATIAGTVKAPESSAFVLEVDATSQKASLRVEKSEVELLAMNSGTISQMSQDEMVTSTVSSGEEKLLIVSGATDVTSQTNPLIVFSTQSEFRQDGNQNANASSTRKSVQQSSRRSSTSGNEPAAVDLPESKEMNVYSALRLNDMASDLEIAKVKLKQLLNNPQNATALAEGYIQTVQRIAENMKPSTEPLIATSTGGQVGDILSKSSLSEAVSTLPSLSKGLEDGEKNAAYQKAKQAIDELYALESAVIIHSKLSEKETIASLPPIDPSANALSTLRSIDEGAYNTKQKIEGAIESDLLSRVEKIIAVEDRDTRAQLFTALLSSIPNDKQQIRLLETLQTKVPEDLKGYVYVKLHTIRNTAAQ